MAREALRGHVIPITATGLLLVIVTLVGAVLVVPAWVVRDEERLWQPVGSAARGRPDPGEAEPCPAEIVENYQQ